MTATFAPSGETSTRLMSSPSYSTASSRQTSPRLRTCRSSQTMRRSPAVNIPPGQPGWYSMMRQYLPVAVSSAYTSSAQPHPPASVHISDSAAKTASGPATLARGRRPKNANSTYTGSARS